MRNFREIALKAAEAVYNENENKENQLVKVMVSVGKEKVYLSGSPSALQKIAGFLERLSVRIRDSTERQSF